MSLPDAIDVSASPATIIPPSRPTRVPTFDVGQVARNVEVAPEIFDDFVFEAVPDVPYSEQDLDANEHAVLALLDGLTPVCMLEVILRPILREEIHSILGVLRARGLARLSATENPRSGMFIRR